MKAMAKKKRLLLLLLLLLSMTFFASCSGNAEAPQKTRSQQWQELYDGALTDGWALKEQWVCIHGGPKYTDTQFVRQGQTQVLCGYTHLFHEE